MPRTVETCRTAKAVRGVVGRVVDERPSGLLRQAAAFDGSQGMLR